jgi:hypothetical protein
MDFAEWIGMGLQRDVLRDFEHGEKRRGMCGGMGPTKTELNERIRMKMSRSRTGQANPMKYAALSRHAVGLTRRWVMPWHRIKIEPNELE